MPRKLGSKIKVVTTKRNVDVDTDEPDLMDISDELEAREIASLATFGQAGTHTRNSLSSDDAQY
jgi:hypothetical protein